LPKTTSDKEIVEMASLYSIATTTEYYAFDVRRLFGHPVRIITIIGSVRTGILTKVNYRKMKMKLMPRDAGGLFEDYESVVNVPIDVVLGDDGSDRLAWNEIDTIEIYNKGDMEAIRP